MGNAQISSLCPTMPEEPQLVSVGLLSFLFVTPKRPTFATSHKLHILYNA